MPSADLSPQAAVERQLDALKTNDQPWTNHGLQTLYEFAEDAGGMERSYYFGFAKDLYHFDHFMGMFQTKLGGLVNLSSYTINATAPPTSLPGGVPIEADVVPATGGRPQRYRFVLVQRQVGLKKGCWMTKQLMPVAEAPQEPAQ